MKKKRRTKKTLFKRLDGIKKLEGADKVGEGENIEFQDKEIGRRIKE